MKVYAQEAITPASPFNLKSKTGKARRRIILDNKRVLI
jgi:hypothetical protein